MFTSYPHLSVDKNPHLSILIGMTILHEYETRVNCDDSHCVIRYYIKGEPLAVGIIRCHYHNAGGINGTVITMSDWNMGTLITDISSNHGLVPNEMEELMREIRAHAVSKIKEHLTHSGEQATSD